MDFDYRAIDRRRTKSGPVVNYRGRAGGAVPGRVWAGKTPPAQPGGMGERCKLPHRGLHGVEPQKPTLFAS